MGKDKDFSVFIKSGHVLYCVFCVVYSHLKAFRKKTENKTQGKISHSTVSMKYLRSLCFSIQVSSEIFTDPEKDIQEGLYARKG